jgi:hypothetical protein
LVSPAGRERHLPVSHRLGSLFPFPSLFFPYFALFYHLSLCSRIPEQFTAPSAMPTSSGAHARALQTAPGMSAPEQPHPAAASSVRSEPPRPASYASAVGDCLTTPGAETEDVSRHATGLHLSVLPMPRQALRQPRLVNSLRCRMSLFLPCPRILREEDWPYLPIPFIRRFKFSARSLLLPAQNKAASERRFRSSGRSSRSSTLS